MLDSLEWRSLEQRRIEQRLIMFNNILKNNIPLPEYLKPVTRPARNFHSHAFKQIQTTNDYYKYLYSLGQYSIGMLYHQTLSP
jgi:hypothetical protein